MSRLLAGLGAVLAIGGLTWWRLGELAMATYTAGLVFGVLLGILYFKACMEEVAAATARALGW